MKKIIFLVFIFFFKTYGQYKIQYDYYTESIDSYGSSKTVSKCYLFTDNIQSKFIKDRVINGEKEEEIFHPDKDLQEQEREEQKSAIFGDSIGYVVVKYFLKDSIYTRTNLNGLIKEQSVIEKFEFFEEYKTILDYRCQKATTKIYGRTFVVWFTDQIPVNDGPWKLHGLPGLILEANSTDNFHNFHATSIKKTTNTKYIYSKVPYKIVHDRDKMWKEVYTESEKRFKYRKSKNPDSNIKVSINDLDIPIIVFE